MKNATLPAANSPEILYEDQQTSNSIRWRPMILSFILHGLMLLLILFALTRFSTGGGGDEPDRVGEIVLAVASEDAETEYLDESTADSQPQESQSSAELVDDFSEEPPPALDIEPPRLDLAGLVPTDNQLDATGMANSETASVTSTPFELSEEDLKLIEAEQKMFAARLPAGPATTVDLFGGGGFAGRKFVFLIDRSKSMGEQGLGVLREARTELQQTIGKLEPHHQFQIIVYNNTTAAIGNRKILKATEENKAKVPLFLGNVVAYAGTNHQNGIYAALAFSPDVLVILSDGGTPELHDGQIKAIARSARNRTKIHALHFGLGESVHDDHFLQRLAESSLGSYRYIDVRTWRD